MTARHYPFRRYGGAAVHTLPHSRYLIFHLKSPKASVDCVQYVVSLVSAPPPIEAGNNNPVGTGEVRTPVQLEAVVHTLATRASIPAQVVISVSHGYLDRVAMERRE